MFDLAYYKELSQMFKLHEEVYKYVDKIDQARYNIESDAIKHYELNMKLSELANKHMDYWIYYIEPSISKNRRDSIHMYKKCKQELSNKDYKLLERFSC